MVVCWLCWQRTILMKNILRQKHSQFPPVHDFGKPWWGVAYLPCVTNLRALYSWMIRWHATGVLSLAEHWHGRRALSNHVCAHSGISMWHVICLQHLARACSEQSKSTSVLPINMWSRCCNAYRDLWIMPIVSLLQSTYSCNVFPSIVFAPVHRRPTDRECHCYKLQGNRSTSPRITSRRLVDPSKLYRPAPGGDNCSL